MKALSYSGGEAYRLGMSSAIDPCCAAEAVPPATVQEYVESRRFLYLGPEIAA